MVGFFTTLLSVIFTFYADDTRGTSGLGSKKIIGMNVNMAVLAACVTLLPVASGFLQSLLGSFNPLSKFAELRSAAIRVRSEIYVRLRSGALVPRFTAAFNSATDVPNPHAGLHAQAQGFDQHVRLGVPLSPETDLPRDVSSRSLEQIEQIQNMARLAELDDDKTDDRRSSVSLESVRQQARINTAETRRATFAENIDR